MLAGIELGGTKCIVVRGHPGAISDRVEFPTADPASTMGRAIEILRDWHVEEPLQAVGIASFGPVRLDPAAADFGRMLATPKPGWTGADVRGLVAEALQVPVAIETDVNAAALAEFELGAARGCGTIVYLTIGTGIGAGILVDGQPVHGLLHPEAGHLRIRRRPADRFTGVCPFHGDCLEGLVSGPALAARFGCHPGEIPVEDVRWEDVASDLAEFVAMLLLTLAPERIVVGGGVARRQPHLLPRALARIAGLMAGYFEPLNSRSVDGIIVASPADFEAGPHGSLIVARKAAGPAGRPV